MEEPQVMPEITPEQIAAWQKKKAEQEQAEVTEALQKVMELAQSLSIELIATAQAVEIAPGVFALAPQIAARKKQNAS